MARGFRLSGDNELAALKQSMRSRMRGDEARHRVTDGAKQSALMEGNLALRGPAGSATASITSTQFAPSEPRSVAGHSDCPINGAKADSGQSVSTDLPDGISGARRPHAASSSTITIPWPPTGNSSVRHGNGSHYLRKEVLDYRRQVAELCIGAKRMTGPYRLKVAFSPPDKRQRDMDNALKSLLDALVLAGFLPSDSMTYMRELYACVVDKRAGIVQVTAEAV